MILEYIIDFRSNTQIYEKIFVKLLKKYSLDGKIIRDDFISKLYVKIENTKNFEEFSEEFSQKLPHSIFLYNTQVKVIENMPQGNTKIDLNKKMPLPFCLDCLSCVMDKNSKHYYDIFTECEVCGYNIAGEHKNYMNDFKKIAHFIKDGNYIKLNTFYGVFVVGQLSQDCDFDFDIIAYDYATLSNYTYAKDYELKALASIEKPFIRLRTNLAFKTKIADIKQELIRFKLADDFILHLLMNELHLLGIDMIFITKSNIKYEQHICLVEPKEIEPIQIVASPTHIALTKGKRGVVKPTDNFALSDDIQACSVVIKEHNLDALTIGCYPHLMGKVCLAASLLADEGIPFACEGDINGAVGQLILTWLTGMPTHHTDFLDATDDGALDFVIKSRTESALYKVSPSNMETFHLMSRERNRQKADLRRTRLYIPGNNPYLMEGCGLFGADIMHLKDLEKIGSGVVSIGGAGTFDGIFLTGVFAVVFSLFLV